MDRDMTDAERKKALRTLGDEADALRAGARAREEK